MSDTPRNATDNLSDSVNKAADTASDAIEAARDYADKSLAIQVIWAIGSVTLHAGILGSQCSALS
jgi:hypothetical protein